MMLAEMSVRESITGRHTQQVRRIISEILPLLFLTGTMLFLSALSASILPKRESLILVIASIIAIVLVLRRWFVRDPFPLADRPVRNTGSRRRSRNEKENSH